MTDLPLIVSLSALGRGDLVLAGGKGANLGELVRAGFDVPPGFVITTAAYDLAFASGSGCSREWVEVPAPVTRAIETAYEQLGAGPVAVRSSAIAEDLPGAAFAGQHDTFLNVNGLQSVLDAVRRCWASLFSERAIGYRQRRGLDSAPVKLAVVVQQMVNAEWAGVMFTANPVTGAREEIVIDSNPGLGDAVVSGLVTPDRAVVKRRWWGLQLAERERGRRDQAVQPRAGGGTEHVGAGDLEPLSPAILKELAVTGQRIAAHFGVPQDIEWALSGGVLKIVQARPITALPQPGASVGGSSAALRMAAEMAPMRPAPLDVDTWIPAIAGAVKPMFEALGLGGDLADLLVIEDGVAVRLSTRFPLRPTWRILLAPAKLIWLALRNDPLRFDRDPEVREGLERARRLEQSDLRARSWAQVLAILDEALALPRVLGGEPRRRYFPRAGLAFGALAALLTFTGNRRSLGPLISGAETLTSKANRALDRLAEQVAASPDLQAALGGEPTVLGEALQRSEDGRRFLQGLNELLDTFGHRESVYTTALAPTWKDAPERVLALIRGLARAPGRAAPDPGGRRALDQLLTRVPFRFGPFRGLLRWLVPNARALLQVREDTHFHATRSLPTVRRALLELGRRLTAGGVLAKPEDVFHLTRAELVGAEPASVGDAALARELSQAVERRAAAGRALAGTPMVDIRSPQPPTGGRILACGAPGSPGCAEGRVRIVRDESQFGALLPGEVLVAPFTNPSWTPLFQRACAAVVDSGSAASHAAIIAREYGIPAVMGTGSGTTTLVDGDWVRVDGALGLVLAIPPRSSSPRAAEREGPISETSAIQGTIAANRCR